MLSSTAGWASLHSQLRSHQESQVPSPNRGLSCSYGSQCVVRESVSVRHHVLFLSSCLRACCSVPCDAAGACVLQTSRASAPLPQ
jgi:hypothetical protein